MILQYLTLIGCSLLGQTIHLLIKGRALQRRANAGNVEFKPIDLIEKDWVNMLLSLTANMALLVGYSELISSFDLFSIWPKCLFILSGYTGSSLVLGALSNTEKAMQDTINTLTNNISLMDYEWVVDFLDPADKVVNPASGALMTIASFAASNGGVVDNVALEIVYASMPSFTSVVFKLAPGYTTTRIAVPIRRPK